MTIDGFAPLEPAGRWPWPVHRGGDGPPVLLLHELFGVSDALLAFARELVAAGFSVWIPVLAGPAPARTRGQKLRVVAGICVSREIHLFRTGRTSPVTGPLRELARYAVSETGASGAGVVGMCLTGGFALALAVDEQVLAAVAAQPSLPLRTPLTPWCGRDIGISPDDAAALRSRIDSGGTEVYVTRFSEDRTSPPGRAREIERVLGGTVDELDSRPGNPYGFGRADHSVLTEARQRHREGPGAERLRRTAEDVVAFLRGRLGVS